MYIAQLFKGTGIGRYLKMEFFNFDTFKNATHLKKCYSQKANSH